MTTGLTAVELAQLARERSRCRCSIARASRRLEHWRHAGLVERSTDGRYLLTDAGRELARHVLPHERNR